MNNTVKAHLSILSANILYGINFFAVKEVVPEHMHPFGLALVRAVGALLLLWIVTLFIKTEQLERKIIWKVAIAGFLGVTINQTLLVWGLSLTSSINASIIMTLNPVFVMIVAAIMLKIPITKKKILGIVIGAGGFITLVASKGKVDFSLETFGGDAIIFVNAVIYGLYLVWTKPLMKKYDSLAVMRWMFLFGTLPVFTYGLEHIHIESLTQLPHIVYWSIAFVVLGATFFTYMLNIIGLKYANPTTVSIYIYLQPIFAALLSVAFGKDSLDLLKILAMILVFVGVYLVSTSNKQVS